MSQCLFLEIFAGTAGLTAAVRKVGLHSSVGVDNSVSTSCKAPIVRLDLTTSHGIQLMWEILKRPTGGDPAAVAKFHVLMKAQKLASKQA